MPSLSSRPRRTLLAALALALPLLGGAQSAHGIPNQQGPPTTAALRICSGCADYGLSVPGRYSYVVLHSWQAGLIPQLKSASPGLKVLVYKDAAASASYACHGGVDDARLPAGVGYCWADANRPDWFLADTTGARIEFCDFHGAWQMDVGDASYQQAWLANVLADLRSAPWDGVMLDDVNQSETWHLCGRTIARYPTADAYTAATESFLAHVGPALRAAGFMAMPNIALDDWWTQNGLARWDRWVSYSSGAVQEYFSKWGRDDSRWLTDDGTHDDWSGRQALFARTEAAGKTFVGVTYAPSGDVRSMRYARASFLLDWNGGPSALAFEPTTPEAQDPYFEDWTTDVGAPTGARVQGRRGVEARLRERDRRARPVALDLPDRQARRQLRAPERHGRVDGDGGSCAGSGPAGGVQAPALPPAGGAPPGRSSGPRSPQGRTVPLSPQVGGRRRSSRCRPRRAGVPPSPARRPRPGS